MKVQVALLVLFLALAVACFGMSYTAIKWTSDVFSAVLWSLLGAGCLVATGMFAERGDRHEW